MLMKVLPLLAGTKYILLCINAVFYVLNSNHVPF